MPQQTINIGAAPDDGTGDTIRVGGDKINDNFTELYTDKLDKAGGTLTGDLIVPDEAYDATAWNGSLEVPTKNALRDKIETLAAGTPTELDDLTDVNAPTPANGEVLTWDSTPGEWVSLAPSGGIAELDDIPDVNAPTPSNGDVLTWDSTPGEWVASAAAGGGIAVEEDGVSEGTGITTLNFTTGLDVSVTGTEATISASGGGGSGYGFEDTPTVPNTSGYTLQNTGTASMANANGSRGIALTTPTATDNVRFVRKNGAPPATPYSLIMRAAPISPRHGGTSRMCVVLRNSTSGRLITWGKQDDFNLYAQRWAGYSTSGGNILLQTGCVFSRMMDWMKISNDGTTLTFSCGPDGENWFDLTTEALATYINASGGSVDEIGFGTTTQSAGFTVVDLFQSFEVV
jgi:hypothetical protein